MKQNNNIFEELGRMKNLIHSRPGVVISEQSSNITTDIDTIVKNIASLSLSSENEKNVVNTIINNSKTKQDFENLLSQFKSKTGKDLTTELPKVLQPKRDDNEISQLKTHLSGIGVTMEPKYTNNRWVGFSFVGLGTLSPSETTNKDDLWASTYKCVPAQPGVKKFTNKDGSTFYNLNGTAYYNNGRKTDGKTVTNYSCVTEFKTPNTQQQRQQYLKNVTNYSNEIQKSLGITPTGKLSDADLDKIISSL